MKKNTNKISCKHILSAIVLIACIPIVSATPPIPESYWGYATLNGVPAPDGTFITVEVYGSGEVVGNTTVKYPNGGYSLDIIFNDTDTAEDEGADGEDALTWKINEINCSIPAPGTDTAISGGTNGNFNLTATIPDTTAPIISNVTKTELTNDSVTISWDTDENSNSVVKYGTTPGIYLNGQFDTSLITLHNISLTELNATTTYYYVVNSTDASGNTGESSEYNFTTTATSDITPPVISNVENTDPTTDSVTISWITNEDSDSVVRYGTTPGNYTNEESNTTLVTLHNIPFSQLSADTTYYYVVNSTDASGNAGQCSEYSFTTATIADNATVVLIGNAIATPNGYASTSIMVNNVTGLGSGNITVTYNPSVVHVTNVTSGDGNALPVQDWNVDNTTGSVRIFVQDADKSHNGDVVFAIVNFHTVGEYPDSTALAISSSELINYTSYGVIGHSVTNGTFSIIDDEPPVITDAIATPDVILNDNGRSRIPGTNVTVLNATVLNGGSGVVNVTINLSSIGGPDDQIMERIAGTDVWTVATTATGGINLTHELVVTATDGADNTNTSVIGLTILLRGDVVRDGDLNSADALYIAKYLVGKEPRPSLLVSDMSPAEGDGRVTSADALYLAKYLVGKEAAP